MADRKVRDLACETRFTVRRVDEEETQQSQQRKVRSSYQEGITCHDICNNVFVSSFKSFVRGQQPMPKFLGDSKNMGPQFNCLFIGKQPVRPQLTCSRRYEYWDFYLQEDAALKEVQVRKDTHSLYVIRNLNVH
uniref:Uncharacterized protein n=1 Tax=Timema bartmani TaxID=61472 RepID=A0A7R9F5P8_9NEOP|nr:unnamed protein product [Timema bartmani]